jgi:hypothetical protein
MIALDLDPPTLDRSASTQSLRLVTSSSRRFSSRGRSEMVVAPFPRLPFVSRPTRPTVALLGTDSSPLQVHVLLSW